MFKEVTLYRFKKFNEEKIKLNPNSLTLLVGGNNSGKSTILHAIAVWEFCKLILLTEKGEESLRTSLGYKGYGLSADEFLPLAIPSLKHLWTNLKSQKLRERDGYTLKVGCKWDSENKKDCYLEFGLSLVNDRLFIKTTSSNLIESDKIPTAAYLPTFAGIVDKENKLSIAERRRLIGKGMAGSVLRNSILDMFIRNTNERKKLKAEKSKISNPDLKSLRNTDPFELLQKAIREIFNYELKVNPFNDLYHTYIKVEAYKVEFKNNRFAKINHYTSRDIMVEGSGFLQWLNVYSLALAKDIDVLLLDEPDAHLHSSLQMTLLERLESFAKFNKKQVLIASHSSEIIKNVEPSQIISLDLDKPKYISTEQQKVGLLSGLGSEYSPRLHKLQNHKNLLFVENNIDAELLKIWAFTLGNTWPNNLVIWPNSSGHKERKQLYLELSKEIPGLKVISLRDRDDEPYNTVDASLIDKSHKPPDSNIIYLKWRRKNIENYLLWPKAVAKATGKTIDEINLYFTENHALSIPSNFKDSEVPSALYDCDGKKICIEEDNSIEKKLGCSRHTIANNMEKNEICVDVGTAINSIIEMCRH